MLQLRHNKSNMVIEKYFYLLMLNKSERHSTGNWTQLRRGGRGLY